jgi:hypothetical protein
LLQGSDCTEKRGDAMADKSEFKAVARELKAIFKPYLKKLVVVSESETDIYIDTPVIMKNKHPIFFGAVRTGKAYVSFHLMAFYCFPELTKAMSPGLKKRMQGKSCLNFTTVDKDLFKELEAVTKLGAAKFLSKEFVKAVTGGGFKEAV